MGKDAQLDVDPAMREAVLRLKQRPELLTYVVWNPETSALMNIISEKH